MQYIIEQSLRPLGTSFLPGAYQSKYSFRGMKLTGNITEQGSEGLHSNNFEVHLNEILVWGKRETASLILRVAICSGLSTDKSY